MIYRYKVQRKNVQSYDGVFPWNYKEEEIVTINEAQSFQYGALLPGLISGAMIEMSLDRPVSVRRVYSVLEWLGDIGGLSKIFLSVCYVIVTLLSPWDWEKYLVKKLYRAQKSVTIPQETYNQINGKDNKSVLRRAMLTQNNRVPISARAKTMIQNAIQHILRKYWTYSKDDILFLKA